MTRPITEVCRRRIEAFEGLRLTAYRDGGGVLTIGYGHTGPDLQEGQTITQAEADRLLAGDLARAERAVEAAVRVPLTDTQFGALVSFTFNVGIGALRSSTLLRRLNAGDYAAVPGELAKWTRVAGRANRGLVNRRAAEAGLWASGGFVASAPVRPAPVPRASLVSSGSLAHLGVVSAGSAAAFGEGLQAFGDTAGQVAGAWQNSLAILGPLGPVLSLLGDPRVLAVLLIGVVAAGLALLVGHRRRLAEAAT